MGWEKNNKENEKYCVIFLLITWCFFLNPFIVLPYIDCSVFTPSNDDDAFLVYTVNSDSKPVESWSYP